MTKKRKRIPKRSPEELRRSEELTRRLEKRVAEGRARMIEKYGEYRVPATFEEYLELREKYRRVDRERERETRPLSRLRGRFARSGMAARLLRDRTRERR